MKTKPPLRLYSVTLDWPGRDEGDFTENFWAKDAEDAIKQCAVEMEERDENCRNRTAKERKSFISDLAASSGYVELVLARWKNDLSDLLTPPDGTMTKEALHVRNVIVDLLALYGVKP